MPSQIPSSSSLRPVSAADYPLEYSEANGATTSSDMLGTPKSVKSTTGVTHYSQTLQTSELNKMSWAKELEGKVNLYDKPLDEFLDVFVPGPGASRALHADRVKNAFKDVSLTGREAEKYPDLVRRLHVCGM